MTDIRDGKALTVREKEEEKEEKMEGGERKENASRATPTQLPKADASASAVPPANSDHASSDPQASSPQLPEADSSSSDPVSSDPPSLLVPPAGLQQKSKKNGGGDGAGKMSKVDKEDGEVEKQRADMEKMLHDFVGLTGENVRMSDAKNPEFYVNSREASLFLLNIVKKVKDPEKRERLWNFVCNCVNGEVERVGFDEQVEAYRKSNAEGLDIKLIDSELFEEGLKRCGVYEDIFSGVGVDGKRSMYDYFINSIATVRSSRAKERAKIPLSFFGKEEKDELQRFESNGLFKKENLSSTMAALDLLEKHECQGDLEQTLEAMKKYVSEAVDGMEMVAGIEEAVKKNDESKKERQKVRDDNFKDVTGAGIAGFAVAIFPVAAVFYLVIREWYGGKGRAEQENVKKFENGIVNGICDAFSTAGKGIMDGIGTTPEKLKKMKKTAGEQSEQLIDLLRADLEEKGINKEAIDKAKEEARKCLREHNRHSKIVAAIRQLSKNEKGASNGNPVGNEEENEREQEHEDKKRGDGERSELPTPPFGSKLEAELDRRAKKENSNVTRVSV
jgi:hypothetical protein